MVVEFLNKTFSRTGYLNNFIEFVWKSSFYDVGQFSLYIRNCDYDEEWAYIVYDNEIAKIQSVEFSQTRTGDYVTLSGFMMTQELNNGVIYPMFEFKSSSPLVNQVATCIATYCPPIGCADWSGAVVVDGNALPDKLSADKQQTGDGVWDCVQPLLETLEIGHKAEASSVPFRLSFVTGTDRTTGSEMVLFNRKWGNVKELKATTDDSNLKNYAIVAGAGEGSERIVVEVDKRKNSADPKRILWVDASDLQQGSLTLSKYKNQLKQRGREKLLDYMQVINLELSTLDKVFLYGEDFFLGDYVMANVDEIGLSVRVQVIEVETVYKDGKKEINLTLGNQKKNKYRRY